MYFESQISVILLTKDVIKRRNLVKAYPLQLLCLASLPLLLCLSLKSIKFLFWNFTFCAKNRRRSRGWANTDTCGNTNTYFRWRIACFDKYSLKALFLKQMLKWSFRKVEKKIKAEKTREKKSIFSNSTFGTFKFSIWKKLLFVTFYCAFSWANKKWFHVEFHNPLEKLFFSLPPSQSISKSKKICPTRATFNLGQQKDVGVQPYRGLT